MKDRLIELIKAYLDENVFIYPADFGTEYGFCCEHLADHLLANGVIVPPCKVGDEIWAINREDDQVVDISCFQFLAKSEDCIIGTAWINDFDINATIEYHINETRDNYECALMVYPSDDCFLTQEEAVQAMRER